MRKLLCLTALYVTITGAVLLTFGARPAVADGCSPRPSGAPDGWKCTLTNIPVCEGGLCQCDYICTPP